MNDPDPHPKMPPLRYILDEDLTHRAGCPQTAKLLYSDECIRCLQCNASVPGHVEVQTKLERFGADLADPKVDPDPGETP